MGHDGVERDCGCRDLSTEGEALTWPAHCPAARKLEAELCQAIKEKDWVGARAIGERLAAPHDAPPATVVTMDARARLTK